MKSKYVILCLYVSVSLAGNALYEGTTYHYTGTIAGKHSIFTNLTVEDGDITGNYCYYSIGTYLDLRGAVSNNEFIINEYVDEGLTGTFKGKFSNGYASAQGTWSNPDNTKKYAVTMDLIAVQMVIEDSSHQLIARFPNFVKLSTSCSASVRDTIESYFDNFAATYEEDLDDIYEVPFEFILGYSIEYYSTKLVSLLLEIYEYTGGAHGNVYYVDLNYTLQKEKSVIFNLDDIFTTDSEYRARLSDLCIAELQQQEACWVVDGSITSLVDALDVFNVTPKGLFFTFAPYVVGPYAEGPHYVLIAYDELVNIIDPKGPLAVVLKK